MAVTITYKHPVSGTTAPTLAEALAANSLVAELVAADADTTAAIVHNWKLSTAELNKYFPLVGYYVSGAGTANPIVSFALSDSSTVTMTKVSAAGSGGTYVVVLSRPHTLVR